MLLSAVFYHFIKINRTFTTAVFYSGNYGFSHCQRIK